MCAWNCHAGIVAEVVLLHKDEFQKVYDLLDHGMADGDCGVPCSAFCCTGAAVKYLLPGEEELFGPRHPGVPLLAKPWYVQVLQSECCCVRQHRMFACRAFPFRPVIDGATGSIRDLVKVKNEAFKPCWIEEPLADWKARAIQAWEIVLGDEENRALYGRVQYLSDLLDEMGAAFFEIPPEELDDWFSTRVNEMTADDRAHLYKKYFPSA